LFSLIFPSERFISLEISRTVVRQQRKIVIILLEKIDFFTIGPRGEISVNKEKNIQGGAFFIENNEITLTNMRKNNDAMVMVNKTTMFEPGNSCNFINGNVILQVNF
jgi:hypothetical protein